MTRPADDDMDSIAAMLPTLEPTPDYHAVKRLASTRRWNVAELLASTPKNDPFYIGPGEDAAQPQVLAWARWVRAQWPRLRAGVTGRVHDRLLHYKLMSFGDVVMPEYKAGGQTMRDVPYDHAHQDKGWAALQLAVRDARYLHYVPYDAIEDQRNPAAANTTRIDPPDPTVAIYAVGERPLELPRWPLRPDYVVFNYAEPEREGGGEPRQIANQRYHLEVWVEKTTQNAILSPWCQAHGAVLVTAQGQMTMTGAWDAAERIRERGKPAVIFYISDFDKAGQSMPLAIARKIERFLRVEYGASDADPPHVLLQTVALTYEHVRHYDLPDMPTDDTKWQERYGIGTVELDALEAYYPGELTRLLDAAAEPYWDATLGERIAEAEDTLLGDLESRRDEVVKSHQARLDELAVEWDAAVAQARALLQPVWDDIQAEHASITEELRNARPSLDNYPLPEAPEADSALAATLLFDSHRTYWQQLAAYTRYKREHVVTEAE